jgi:hypothetical protein
LLQFQKCSYAIPRVLEDYFVNLDYLM